MADNGIEPAPARPGNLGRNDYPRMLFHPDGRTCGVNTPEEHDPLMREGWDTIPAEIHLQRPPSQAPAMSAGDPLGLMIRQIMVEVLNEVLDERGMGKRNRYTGPRS